MLAIACPGQGSQTPGFLTPWLDLPGVREHLEQLSDRAGTDLIRRVDTFEVRLNRDPFVIADRLWVKGTLDPEEEKLRFSN